MFIDYEKYKRFFAFGCSFTSHIYPTWADIVASEMPHAEYFNFGKAGAGNPFICSRIVEANCKFKFNSTDLIIVMFSTLYREDRFMKGNWICNGNIYNSCLYGKKFVEEFADPVGYLLRDFTYFEFTKCYLDNLPSKNILLISTDYQEDLNIADSMGFTLDLDLFKKIEYTYNDVLKSFPKSLKEIVCDENNNWKIGHQYIWNNEIHYDPHPNPKMYYDYLQELNFNLSEKSKTYVMNSMDTLQNFKNKNDFSKLFQSIYEKQNYAKKFLF